MPKVRLTDVTLKSLRAGIWWDDLLPAFGCRVGKNRITFMVVKDRSRTKVRVGQYPAISLQEARSKARVLLSEKSLATGQTATADAIETFTTTIKVRPKTLYEYKRLLASHLEPVLGRRKLDTITATDCLAITDKLAKTPAEQIHCHTAMRAFFNWCVPRYLSISPMHALKTPAKQKQRSRVLNDDEIKRVWAASEQLGRFGHIIRVCILTGLRRSEVAALERDWLLETTLVVPAHVSKNGRTLTLPRTA